MGETGSLVQCWKDSYDIGQQEKIDVTCIHNLVWLENQKGVVTPVDHDAGHSIADVSELGEGRFELHWFSNEKEAVAFQRGIELVGSNTTLATRGLESVSNCVLVCRLDKEAKLETDLNKAVELIEHADSRSRKARLTWFEEAENLKKTSANEYASIRPAYIDSIDENHMSFRFFYDRWRDSPDFGRFKYNGTQQFTLTKNGKEKWIEVALNDASAIFSMGTTRSKPWLAKLTHLAETIGGSLVDRKIRIPLHEPITDALVKIAPIFAPIYDLEIEAADFEKKRKFTERPETQKTINALSDGACIMREKDAIILRHAQRQAKLTQKFFHELIENKIIVKDGVTETYCLSPDVHAVENSPLELTADHVFKFS